MPYIARNPDGSIYGKWATPQWPDHEYIPDDHPDLTNQREPMRILEAVPTSRDDLSTFKANAHKSLVDTDEIVIRCVESDVKLPSEWKAYRKALREIVNGTNTNYTAGLPKRPVDPLGI